MYCASFLAGSALLLPGVAVAMICDAYGIMCSSIPPISLSEKTAIMNVSFVSGKYFLMQSSKALAPSGLWAPSIINPDYVLKTEIVRARRHREVRTVCFAGLSYSRSREESEPF